MIEENLPAASVFAFDPFYSLDERTMAKATSKDKFFGLEQLMPGDT